MCFSASASFSVGAALLGVGLLSLRAAHGWRECCLAAVPLLFALQQWSEGALWWTFGPDTSLASWRPGLTYLYSFFSHALWPVYIPLAVWAVEPDGKRRQALLGLGAVGLGVAAFLLLQLAAFGVQAQVDGGRVEYASPHRFPALAMTLYVAATTFSPMLSSHRALRVFGQLALLSLGLAYYFYTTWFISVWCFFAALLSMSVYVHFASRRTSFVSPVRLVDV